MTNPPVPDTEPGSSLPPRAAAASATPVTATPVTTAPDTATATAPGAPDTAEAPAPVPTPAPAGDAADGDGPAGLAGGDPAAAGDPAATGGPVRRGTGGDVDLSIVVPAYNESGRLLPTLRAIRDHLDSDSGTDPGRRGSWELIVVDDGSTDDTADIARAAAGDDPRIHLVTAPVNRGKGHALRLGVLASYGRRVLVTDADLATPIEELDQLDRLLDEGNADAVIGSRALPDSRIDVHQWRGREWLGRAGNLLIRLIAVPGLRDTQCGFKLFDGDRARAAFAASRLDGWAIDVEILRHFRRNGWPVLEAPVRWSHRTGSKVRPLDYGRVLGELVRLRTAAVTRADLAVVALFCLASLFLYQNLWFDLDRGYLTDAGQDQNQWEWFFAVTADNVTHLRNPLFTHAQNAPDGVNLMANTVMLGLSVPLTPVTLLLGPTVTWALVLTFGLAATAAAWYWLIVRRVTPGRRAPAALGAAVAAFAPPMISHGNAHPNFLVLFVLPLIVDRTLRLCAGRDVVRDGVVLGLLATYQIFIGEEPLLLAAMGLLLFALAYALLDREAARRSWRPLLRGTGIGLAVCLPLVAGPLAWQFFGPQSYSGVMHSPETYNSPRAFLEFAGRSLFGTDERADPLAMNRTEQNAFYGWPLLLLAGAIVVRLWQRTLIAALALTAGAAALLSLGTKIPVPFTSITLPGPWTPLGEAPLLEAVIESRIAMICAPVLGMILAVATVAATAALTGTAPGAASGSGVGTGTVVGTDARRSRFREPAVSALGAAVLAAALVPILPTPYQVREREEVPAFIADGAYRRYLAPGESLVTVPLPSTGDADALYWQSSHGFDFPLAGGYFVGPWGPDDLGIYGAVPRHTSQLLDRVADSGQIPEIGPLQREQARADLAEWSAGAVILPPQYNEDALQQTLEALLGRPGTWTGGVLVWDVGAPGPSR
ncbi:dolichyl-phosphate beta-glucosyltransferase [Streptomyces sp. NPDC006798]|uniref:dolichyl-phosphate beta-glucosyltransferase n=1 Tax=Streptomyces sp. NPDC006798 TaxID=3155462 RepID=UPI0033C325A9